MLRINVYGHLKQKEENLIQKRCRIVFRQLMLVFLHLLWETLRHIKNICLPRCLSTRYISKKFDLKFFIRNLTNVCKHDISIDIERFSAFRSNPAAVGLIIADSLKNWQSPSIVNKYFKAFGLKKSAGHPLDFYSNDTKETLSILWQMRHSIVHTASTITIPDSQKIEKLKGFAGKEIVLDLPFIMEVARKFHPIIKESTGHLKECFIPNLKDNLTPAIQTMINKLFEVKSSCAIWLK